MQKKTARNILLFITITLASGWIGVLIDSLLEPQPQGDTLGMGIWLVLPLLVVTLLRTFAGDGWKDFGLSFNFKRNLKWYFVSILIFPVISTFVLLVGKITGWISFSNFNTTIFISGFVSVLAINFIKNIFEEFVWRGYLTTKLLQLKIKDFWLYLTVGGIWGIWHLPYYLFFLPESNIIQILPTSQLIFAVIAIISMICWSVMFVELYRITNSIWSVVILHTIEDSLINHLIIDNHIIIVSGKEFFISPIVGIIATVFYLIVGLLLRKSRIEKEKNIQ